MNILRYLLADVLLVTRFEIYNFYEITASIKLLLTF